MSIESLPEQQEPVRQRSGRWRGFLRRLGLIESTSQREGNGEVSNSGEGITLEDVQKALNEVERERREQTPPSFPEPLELGPQRDIDPGFWGPENGSIKDESYQDSLKLLPVFKPAHASAKHQP